MSSRKHLLDMFLHAGVGAQPEFEAALASFEAEVLRRAAKHVIAVGEVDGEGFERSARYAADILHGMAERSLIDD